MRGFNEVRWCFWS